MNTLSIKEFDKKPILEVGKILNSSEIFPCQVNSSSFSADLYEYLPRQWQSISPLVTFESGIADVYSPSYFHIYSDFHDLERTLIIDHTSWKVVLTRGAFVTSKEYEEKALDYVLKRFRGIDKIQSIYSQKYQEEINIYIIFESDSYNEKLIDEFLDIEYEIVNEFSSMIFNFQYLPIDISSSQHFIHPKTRCIFQRDLLYGRQIDSSIASTA